MNKIIMALALAFACVYAHADGVQSSLTNGVTSSGTGTGTALNSGQGNGNTINSYGAPVPSKESITERNVSAGQLGAFSSSLNSFDCHYTAAGANIAIAGLSITGQGSGNDKDFCVKGWTQAELARQSIFFADRALAAKMQQASINIKCSLDEDIYAAMVAAGIECQTAPKDMDTSKGGYIVKNTDGQEVRAHYVAVYDTAQTK